MKKEELKKLKQDIDAGIVGLGSAKETGSFKAIAESSAIFYKYDKGKYRFGATHDEIWTSVKTIDVTVQDAERLIALGWHISDGYFNYFT